MAFLAYRIKMTDKITAFYRGKIVSICLYCSSYRFKRTTSLRTDIRYERTYVENGKDEGFKKNTDKKKKEKSYSDTPDNDTSDSDTSDNN